MWYGHGRIEEENLNFSPYCNLYFFALNLILLLRNTNIILYVLCIDNKVLQSSFSEHLNILTPI